MIIVDFNFIALLLVNKSIHITICNYVLFIGSDERVAEGEILLIEVFFRKAKYVQKKKMNNLREKKYFHCVMMKNKILFRMIRIN